MRVVLSFKWDPRADGRTAVQGDMVSVQIEYGCPLDSIYRIKVGRVGADGEIVYQNTTRTDWTAVANYFSTNWGVLLPSQPSCPGY